VDILELRRFTAETLRNALLLQAIVEHYDMSGVLPSIRAVTTGLREVQNKFTPDVNSRPDRRRYNNKDNE
jgi:hypothetical protein